MLIRSPKEDIEKVIFTESQIQAKVAEIATSLSARFCGSRPVIACVLKGASFFFIDLCRKMTLDADMDFISVSSYGASSRSSGIVKLNKDLDNDIFGRDLVIVEDIIDSGLTLKYLKNLFLSRRPTSVLTVSLLKKASSQGVKVDFAGFDAPDAFLVGYGLDYASHYRNLPYIAALKKECYE